MAGELIQYQTEDGVTIVRLQARDGNVWLSQDCQLYYTLGLRKKNFYTFEGPHTASYVSVGVRELIEFLDAIKP